MRLYRLFQLWCVTAVCAAIVVLGWEAFSSVRYHAQKENLRHAETLLRVASVEFQASTARLRHHTKRSDLGCDVLRQVSTEPVRTLIARFHYFVEHARLMSGLEKQKGQLSAAQSLVRRAGKVEREAREYEKLVRLHELRVAGACDSGTLAEASYGMPLLFIGKARNGVRSSL